MIDLEEVKGKIRGPSGTVMTRFKDSYELNIEPLKENIRFLMDGGIGNGKGHIICPCGTGEYMTLSPEEHKMVVEAVVEVGGNKLPVVAGVQSCDYRVAIELALNAAEAGAKCVMLPPPYYFPLSQEDIYRWYKIIAEGIKGKIGIMAYDQPWRVHVGSFFSVPLLGKLAEIESIVAIKYSAEEDYITGLGLYSKRFSFINNTHSSFSVAHMHGDAGYITSTAAWWPEFEAKYWSLLEQRKYEEADKWHSKMSPFLELRRSEDPEGIGGGGRYIKTALEYVGLYGGPQRPPFIGLTKEQKKKIFGILEAIGVPKKR